MSKEKPAVAKEETPEQKAAREREAEFRRYWSGAGASCRCVRAFDFRNAEGNVQAVPEGITRPESVARDWEQRRIKGDQP